MLGFKAERRGPPARRRVCRRRWCWKFWDVKLQAGLVRKDLNVTSAYRIAYLGHRHGSFVFAQDKILVISAVRNRFGDRMRLAKVERSAFYRFRRTSWDSFRIYGRISVGINAGDIVEDRGRGIIRKVKVGVVGQVNDCCAVRRRRVAVAARR